MVKGVWLIWAMDRNGLIGKDGGMPWHLPAELQYFRKTTMGHPVIMGRKTFESLGKPLPGRHNVVLSRNPDFYPGGVEVMRHPGEVLDAFGGSPFFVMGGAQIYRIFLPHAEKLYVTRIDHAFEGDEWFPEVDWSRFRLVSGEDRPADERNPYPFRFEVYERTDQGD